MSSLLSTLQPSRRRAWWLALVAWCGVIFAFSAQPHLGTDLGLLDTVLRKGTHMVEYGVLALIASMALRQEGIATRRAAAWALFGCVLYAATDEFHQTFVAGRHGTPVDVGIDAVGAAIAGIWLARRTTTDTTGAPS